MIRFVCHCLSLFGRHEHTHFFGWRLLLGTQPRLLLFSALAFANVAAVAQSFAQRDYMTALASRDSVL